MLHPGRPAKSHKLKIAAMQFNADHNEFGPFAVPAKFRGHDRWAGDHFSIGDVTRMATMMVGDAVRVDVAPALNHVTRWNDSVRVRPS